MRPAVHTRVLASFAAFLLLLLAFAAPAYAAPSMWKVEGPRGSVYIVGTIHMLPPDVAWRSTALDRAVASADRLVLELSPEEMNDPALARLMLEKGRAPAGQSLKTMIPADLYADINGFAAENGLPPGSLDMFRPWMAGLVLTLHIAQKSGFDPESGVETQLLALARNTNADAQIRGLETGAEQVGFMASLAGPAETALLADSLHELKNRADLFDQLAAYWAAGDDAALAALLFDSIDDYPEAHDAIFTARNKRWVPEIKALTQMPGLSLVAVGAGHLLGEDSVIDLLRKEGLTVTKLGE